MDAKSEDQSGRGEIDYKRRLRQLLANKVLGRVVETSGSSWEAAMQAAAKECFEELKTATRSRTGVPRAHPLRNAAPPASTPWQTLEPTNRQTAVKHPWAEPVPGLAHGLDRILHRDNKTAFGIDEKVGGKPFANFLRKIAQPGEIDWDQISGFVPPSRDESLHRLAVKHQRKYKASTSSFTGLIGHVYQVLSNSRPIDVSDLSKEFARMPQTLSPTLRFKPVVSILTRKDEVWAIDSEPQLEHENQILIDLGKSMERMLTMNEKEFSQLLLETPGGDGSEKPAVPQDLSLGAYNFSMTKDFMLRSQLDCMHGEGMIFDIKTRATHAIRQCFNLLPEIPASERHLHFLDYKIKSKKGLWFSFEREMYDMIRSAFLKYACQIRIGRMDGAFVAYHNTREIFGFQYVPLSFMDKTVFGSSHMAHRYFLLSSSLIGRALDETLLAFDATHHKLRLSVIPTTRRALKIRLEPATIPDGTEEVPAREWHLWVRTLLNGKEEEKPWNFTEHDKLEVQYCFEEVEAADEYGSGEESLRGEQPTPKRNQTHQGRQLRAL